MENKPEEENKPVKPRTAVDIVVEALLRKIDRVEELESDNKSLQEKLKIAEHLKELDDDAIVTLQKEVEFLNGDIRSYRNGHEINAKRYNDLLTELKTALDEVERLKAEVMKEKFPEN